MHPFPAGVMRPQPDWQLPHQNAQGTLLQFTVSCSSPQLNRRHSITSKKSRCKQSPVKEAPLNQKGVARRRNQAIADHLCRLRVRMGPTESEPKIPTSLTVISHYAATGPNHPAAMATISGSVTQGAIEDGLENCDEAVGQSLQWGSGET